MIYQVPQFIEVESKIVGPLTLKQFIYLAGGLGLCLIFFFTLPIVVAVLFSIPVVAFSVALAFYKLNGKPFIEIVEAGFTFYIGRKLFLWKHTEQVSDKGVGVTTAETAEVSRFAARATPRLTSGKLSELAWSLDVKETRDGDASLPSRN